MVWCGTLCQISVLVYLRTPRLDLGGLLNVSAYVFRFPESGVRQKQANSMCSTSSMAQVVKRTFFEVQDIQPEGDAYTYEVQQHVTV